MTATVIVGPGENPLARRLPQRSLSGTYAQPPQPDAVARAGIEAERGATSADSLGDVVKTVMKNLGRSFATEGFRGRLAAMRALGMNGFIEGLRMGAALESRFLLTTYLKMLGLLPDTAEEDDFEKLTTIVNNPDAVEVIICARLAELGFDGTEARAIMFREMRAAMVSIGTRLSGNVVEYDESYPLWLRDLASNIDEIVEDRAAAMGEWLAARSSVLADAIWTLNTTMDPRYMLFHIDLAQFRMIVASIMPRPDRADILAKMGEWATFAGMHDVLRAAEADDWYDDRGWIRMIISSMKYAARRAMREILLVDEDDPVVRATLDREIVRLPLTSPRHDPDALRPRSPFYR